MRAARLLPALLLAALAVAERSRAGTPAFPCAFATSALAVPRAVTRAELQRSRARAPALGAFTITIVPAASLATNPAALAAWERAAAQWEAVIADPVTVTIAADVRPLDEPGVLGQTAPALVLVDYGPVRDALAAAALVEPDDGVTALLPAEGALMLLLPPGSAFLGAVVATKANLKALGFTGLDAQLGPIDASIDFNAAFPFDFDSGDGVTPGQIDFESVAAHELGHALGFLSIVDALDQGLPLAAVTPLDLFRFADGSADDPTIPPEFTVASRSLVPGAVAVLDDLAVERPLSTGVARGDGRQASHWKDDALTGVYVGLMDPTLSPRTTLQLTAADTRALDVIGWDVATDATLPSFTTTTTTPSTSTTTVPECVEDAACADGDPCTRDFCGFPVCVQAPIRRPADALPFVPVAAALEPCATAAVPRGLRRLEGIVRETLERADRTRRPRRRLRLLDRALRVLARTETRVAAAAGAGRIDAACASAVDERVAEARTAVACVQRVLGL